jgi:hypothetical protein
LGDELECQEAATLPFSHNYFRYNRNPFAIAGKVESVLIPEFFRPERSGGELGKDRRLTLA